jgi:DNA-binding CsgD family transcriptional regulator
VTRGRLSTERLCSEQQLGWRCVGRCRLLTSRQTEVLQLASEGRAAKEIARFLGISVRTVEGHFGAMRQRTGTRNMAELIAWGIQCGFIPHPVLDGAAVSL